MRASERETITIAGIRGLLAERFAARPAPGRVTVPLSEARGLVLAEPVRAVHDLPGFDNSAMDGFAVRSAEAETGSAHSLPVGGALLAGEPTGASYSGAVRIMTGARMPDGYNAVVPLERAELSRAPARANSSGPGGIENADVTLTVKEWPAAGTNVRRRGEDALAGAEIVPAGRRITAPMLAAAAASGQDSLTVWRRPRIAVLTTGRELGPGDRADERPATIFDSNRVMLGAAAEEAGAVVVHSEQVDDDPDNFLAALARAVLADPDLIVTAGGIGGGDSDVVHGYLRGRDDSRVLSVAMRPGSPHGVGSAGGIPLIALPGNPVAAFASFELIVRPELPGPDGGPASASASASSRANSRGRRPLATAHLAATVVSRAGREHFVPVELRGGDDDLVAVPLRGAGSGSHLVARTATMSGYLLVDAATETISEGTAVRVHLLP